jgi:hypothetical protein
MIQQLFWILCMNYKSYFAYIVHYLKIKSRIKGREAELW